MKTTEPDRTKFQSHASSGNGFVIVADVPNFPQYVYVGNIHTAGPNGGKWMIGDRYYVAAKDKLENEMRGRSPEPSVIESEALEVIAEVRSKIESGKFKVVNTRLVEVV